jgi:aminoglycoside phosphotransferase (APT) family kinase protein
LTSVEEGWRRGFPILELDPAALAALLDQPVLGVELLAGGLRNTNYRVQLTGGPAVVRLYAAEAAACQREAALLHVLHGEVPVPLLLDARPDADPPWALFEFVDGVRFDRAPSAGLGQHAYDAGAVLAAIHAFPLERAAHVDLNRYNNPRFSTESIFDTALGFARPYLGALLTDRAIDVVREHSPRLRNQDLTLQHSDYKPWNLLVRDGRIAAVLDWEFAFAGPRLNDIGNFIRYSDRQPPEYLTQFAAGYQVAGGTLPDDWFRLARLQDLIAVGFFFERADADPAIARDVVPLIERTVQLF